MSEVQEYPRRTQFKRSNSACIVTEAWFDIMNPPDRPNLWLVAKDGDRVCIPAEQMETLKKLIRRGRNP